MESLLWDLVAYGLLAAFGGVAVTSIAAWCWLSLAPGQRATVPPDRAPPVQGDPATPHLTTRRPRPLSHRSTGREPARTLRGERRDAPNTQL